MVTGIDSANCKYTCIWCKCPKDSRWITDKTWDSRTADTNSPLFPFTLLQNVVIDNLHLLLQVTDIHVDLLLAKVIQVWRWQVFEAAVSNLLRLAWNFYSEGSGRLKWRLKHLVDEGAFLHVREVRCGKCGQKGHYKTTCSTSYSKLMLL